MIFRYFFLLFCFSILSVNAQESRFGITDMHGKYIPANITLWNEDSISVKLDQIIDKPTLVAFVYYKCPGICPSTLNGVAELINKSNLKIGKDYQVVTISIDNRETPSLGKLKKKNYLNLIKNENSRKGWNFYSADSINISKLTSALGFQFQKKDSTITHPAALIVLTPKGKISRYLFGTYFLPMELEIAVKDAKNEISGASRIKAIKYCYNNGYSFNKTSLHFIIVTGILFLSILVVVIYWLLKSKRIKQQTI